MWCGGHIWLVVVMNLCGCRGTLPWVKWQVLGEFPVSRVVGSLRRLLLLMGSMLLPVMRWCVFWLGRNWPDDLPWWDNWSVRD